LNRKSGYFINWMLPNLFGAIISNEQIGDIKGIGGAFSNIGLIYKKICDYDAALNYCQQSLAIMQQIGDWKGEGVALNNIGQIYESILDYETALIYLKCSLAIHQQIGNRQAEGKALNNIGKIYFAKCDYDTALAYLQQSLSINQQAGDIGGLATTCNNIGAIYFEQKNDIENSIPLFMQSYTIFQKIGSPNVQYPANYLNKIVEQIGEQKFQETLSKQNQQ
jgi:tetratricopeptide (TPR) repeat protein